MSLFQNLPTPQAGLAFPASLSEKYRPHTFSDFVGLEKPKKILAKFADAPYPSAWLFVGPSGTGKTSMALAFCERSAVNFTTSRANNVTSKPSRTSRGCAIIPATGKSFHVVVCDEADRMSKAAQLALLSKLDATAFPPNTIFIFTCNAIDGLEDRFISRTRQIAFQSHGIGEQAAKLLETIWEREARCRGEAKLLAYCPRFTE